MHFIVGWPQEYFVYGKVVDLKHSPSGRYTAVITDSDCQVLSSSILIFFWKLFLFFLDLGFHACNFGTFQNN